MSSTILRPKSQAGAELSGMTVRGAFMQDDSTTVVQLDTAFDEESISKIYFFTTFTDTDPGNAGSEQTFLALPGRMHKPRLLGIRPAHGFREGMQHNCDVLRAAAGTYTLQFPCQFDFNSAAIFNPVGVQHFVAVV